MLGKVSEAGLRIATGVPAIVKVTAFDVPPPGAGLVTVTGTDPTVVTSVAGTVAVNCVALTKVVARAAPLNLTTEVLTNPVPFTISGKPAEPAKIMEGDSEVITGAGLFATVMVSVSAFDVPPPGAGLVTVIDAEPAFAISVAGIEAFTCVALTNVVVCGAPLKLTTELAIKPVPFTVSENAAEPAAMLAGASEVIVGAGLFAALIVKFTAAEVPPPGAGLVTVTGVVPAVVTALAAMVALIWVALTNVVVCATPLKLMTELERKFVPFTVSVKLADPAATLVGDNAVIVGAGLVNAGDREVHRVGRAAAWYRTGHRNRRSACRCDIRSGKPAQ